MPGLLSLSVKEGQDVKAGEPLAIVEATKMENVLKAERNANVKTIYEKVGATLAVDQMILEFAELCRRPSMGSSRRKTGVSLPKPGLGDTKKDQAAPAYCCGVRVR